LIRYPAISRHVSSVEFSTHPDNQRPDKWSSTVLDEDNTEQNHKITKFKYLGWHYEITTAYTNKLRVRADKIQGTAVTMRFRIVVFPFATEEYKD